MMLSDRDTHALRFGFGLSIPVFFVTANAWVMWIVVPLLVSRRRMWRHREANPAPGDTAPGDSG